MACQTTTYVVFDGDNDIWAYGRMKGWNALPTVPFNFGDAHNLGPELTDRASEATVKRALRQRFSNAKNVAVLIGQKTRNLYRYVRWELEVALRLDLPIIAVNLNGKRAIDHELCPPVIRDEYVVHIPFRLAVIRHAIEQFPAQHTQRMTGGRGPSHYPDQVYQRLGLIPVPVSPSPIQPISPSPTQFDANLFRPNLFPPLGQSLSGCLGYLPPSPPQSQSLAVLMCPKMTTLPPSLPWLKKLGE